MPERAIRRYSCPTFIYSQGRNRVLTSLIRFAFISVLFSSAAAFSADNASISTEPSASQVTPQNTSNTQLPEWFYRELTSIRKDVSMLDATGASKEQVLELKERIGKVEVRFEAFQSRIDDKLSAQGKYVEAINASTDRFGTLASILGLVASIIAVIFGWVSAGKKAKSEAKKHVDDWLENNKAELDAQLAEAKEKAKESLEGTLEAEIVSAKKQIEELIRSSKGKIEKVEARVESLNESLKDVVSKIEENEPEKITDTSRNNIHKRAEEVSTKPMGERTAEDWKLLAVKSYIDKKFSESLDHIDQVLAKEHVLTNKEIADSLFLKGMILNKSKRFEEVVEVLGDLINRFKANDDLAIQDVVTKAQMNQGGAFSELNRFHEAIVVCDSLLEQFNDSNEPIIQERIATALVNKAFALGKLNKLEDKIAVYDELLERFKDNKDIAIQRNIVKALVNKAITLGQLNRSEEAIAVYDALLERFKESDERKRAVNHT